MGGPPACAVIVHDGSLWSQANFIGDFNKQHGVNLEAVLIEMDPLAFYPERDYSLDARFLMWQQLLHDHPEWDEMWMSDSFDAVVWNSPCNRSLLPKGVIYTQEEVKETLVDTYMDHRFLMVGGKYRDFWLSDLAPHNKTWRMLNCGLLGGERSIMLEF